MDALQSINTAVLAIGIPSIVVALIYIGRKLQVLDDLEKTSEKIKNNLKAVCDHLIGRDRAAFDSGKLQAYSPGSLTDLGFKYLQEMSFIDVFNQNSFDFFQYISGEQPNSAYDIENAATRSISILFDKPYFQPVKEYLYNHPKADKGEFLQVAGIYVRDKYQEYKTQ